MDAKQEKHAGLDEVDLKDDSGLGVAGSDPALEARITRKLDLHILPWIFALWLLAFIDRSNIGTLRSKRAVDVVLNIEFR